MALVEIGHVCRLQIQRSSLKVGPPKGRRYDPAPLRQVEWLQLTRDGVETLIDGHQVLDIHHARHPDSKNRELGNGISVGFTTHYARMRHRFGECVVDGIAGENILIATDRDVDLEDISRGIVLTGIDGQPVTLERVSIAHPCVEFSRFVMNDPDAPPLAVSEMLQFLDNGTRGYYACIDSSTPLRVEVGDLAFAEIDR